MEADTPRHTKESGKGNLDERWSNQASQMLGERERERCCVLLGTVAGCFVPIGQAWLCILDAAGFDAIGPELEFEDIRALG